MLVRLVLVLGLVVAGCSSAGDGDSSAATTAAAPGLGATSTTTTAPGSLEPPGTFGPTDSQGNPIGDAPAVPVGPLDATTIATIEALWGSFLAELDVEALEDLGATGDPRLAWLVSDVLRFFQSGLQGDVAVATFNALTGSNVIIGGASSPWKAATDRLFAWETPAPPNYVDYKERLYTLVEPGWREFFADAGSTIDWRFVSWGGVRIDDRPLGDPNPCERGCIPALDDPGVTDAAGGSWYADDGIVFAVEINGEARAYPKHIMEVHEMVNDTVGNRRIGMPYCTLCGSAQAYFTDAVPEGVETPVLRTSGLLARSNKVMYDLVTNSVFDTFLGTALSGPLRESSVTLEPVSVVTTTWGDWKAAHPDTTIVAEDGGIGRRYSLDPLGGRDDDGPIFPVGDVDPRLPVQEQVLGVIAPSGVAIAFPAAAARDVLESGGTIEISGVRVVLDGGGLRATDSEGNGIPTHQSFWFAWSQFQPGTVVWSP